VSATPSKKERLEASNVARTRVVDTLRELEEAPAQKRLDAIKALRHSFYVFTTNYEELERALTYHDDTGNLRELWEVRKQYRLRQLQRELLRLLHNFVAAALSLIDHTRVLYRKLYEPYGLMPLYTQQVAHSFHKDGASQFVVGLRKFCQHYRLPNLTSLVSFEREKALALSIYLPKADLAGFDGWSSVAKVYLDQSPDQIDIRRCLREYYVNVRQFYGWFGEQQQAIHAPDVAEVNELARELRDIVFRDIPGQARRRWRQREPHTLSSLEEPFIGILSELEWASLDAVREGTTARGEAMLSILQRKGVREESFEDELRAWYRSVPSEQP